MKKLLIRWQRLIESYRTCPRCEETEKEMDSAYEKIKKALSHLSIEVVLEKRKLSMNEFKTAPLKSNQIWINEIPLEEWLNAKVGQSKCCDICGDQDCRTVEFLGRSYETIPTELIIKACLLAAADMISPKSQLFNVPRGTLKNF